MQDDTATVRALLELDHNVHRLRRLLDVHRTDVLVTITRRREMLEQMRHSDDTLPPAA